MYTNTITGKSYIGQTVQRVSARWRSHCSRSRKGSSTHFHNAIRKYGTDVWKCTLLHVGVDISDVYALEVYYIKLYDTYNNGYNSTLGGEGTVGNTISEGHRNKLRELHTGNKYGKGWKPTEHQKVKQREALLGRKLSDKAIELLKCKTGYKHHNAKPVDIYEYASNVLLVSNVIIREWVRHNPSYDQATLNRTALGKAKQHKGIYAVYTISYEDIKTGE